jgi:Flp pilus assembly protein TadD
MFSDLSLRKMLGDPYKELTGAEGIMVYTRGWLLTHYLAFEPSRHGQLDRYLQLLQQGRPQLEAAQTAFGDLRQLGRELDAYVKRKSLPGLRVPKDKLPTAVPVIRGLGDAEAAAVGILSRLDRRSRLHRGDAIKIADDAAQIAQRWPNDATVQAIFARAAVAAGRDADAIAAADRALAVSPDNVTALVAKARAQTRIGSAAPRSADWAGIRALLLHANKIDTENAEPLMLYYQSFAAAGEVPTPNATKALLYARVLIPQDDELRLLAARPQVTDGRFADAQATLGPLAYDPHSKNRVLSAKAMTAVAASDRAASLTAIDELLHKIRNPRGRS